MSVCPVCKKEFKNLNTHLSHASKKDDDHKKYLENFNEEIKGIVDVVKTSVENKKTYKPGDIVSFKGKGEFEIVEDLGEKVIVRRPGNNLIRLTVKKERI